MNAPKTKHKDEVPCEKTEQSAADHSAEQPTGANQPSLEEQLRAALAERDANYDKWMRAEAELENYRKRVQKETSEHRLYQALPLVRDLLPGLDNLQRAIAAAENSESLGELLQGVQMVAKQFEDMLAKHAAVPIEAVGEPFDPNLHEAVQQMPSSDHPAMTVLKELERGYRLNDRVVRPSKVIVSSGPPAEDATKSDPQKE